MTIRIALDSIAFREKEKPLLDAGGFRVSTFRYDTSIAALRIANRRGEIIVLPFKGHQIWRARFDGRDLTMKSMFDQPVDTRNYLETYGAFFIHCGITTMGPSGPMENYPLHGELPNAPFQTGSIVIDEVVGSLTVEGHYQHTVAFTTNYRATSSYRLKADEALIDASLKVENIKKTPMDLMYLAHANFRPVDDGELVYSADYRNETVRVRTSIPGHITPMPGYREFIAELAIDPSLHHRLKAGLGFDPEVVFSIDMKTDAQGLAHALLKRPDGTSDHTSYRPAQAKHCIRWICRTPDQDAIGMAFPSTSEVEGYTAEKIKGNVVILPAGAVWNIDMRLGALTKSETEQKISLIEAIRKS
ncbi:MAG: DUF4432 family protein [Nitrosospira sp.]|nr:DUF4432 family protein [Nitrosospira sp.]